MAQVHHAGLSPRDPIDEFGRWSPTVRFDWREWDGEFVLRVEDTASTLLLSPLAGETLKAMRDGASYVDEIAALVFADGTPHSAAASALAAKFAETDADTQALLAVLAELKVLGLARVELT